MNAVNFSSSFFFVVENRNKHEKSILKTLRKIVKCDITSLHCFSFFRAVSIGIKIGPKRRTVIYVLFQISREIKHNFLIKIICFPFSIITFIAIGRFIPIDFIGKTFIIVKWHWCLQSSNAVQPSFCYIKKSIFPSLGANTKYKVKLTKRKINFILSIKFL